MDDIFTLSSLQPLRAEHFNESFSACSRVVAFSARSFTESVPVSVDDFGAPKFGN